MFKYKIFIMKDDRIIPVYGIGNGAETFTSAMKILEEIYDEEIERVEWLSFLCHESDVLEFTNGDKFEEFEDQFDEYYW